MVLALCLASPGLAERVPAKLSVVALTPSADSAVAHPGPPEPTILSGREGLSITFSRAVIALGADFAPGALPRYLTPFHLTPAVNGSLRWVTTSIARFDPADDWPAELSLTLRLNTELTAYDGAALANSSATWPFKTPRLTMRTGRVRSVEAERLTNGSWSAELHPLTGAQLELPPDGTLELRFGADVELALLRRALRVQEHGKHAVSSPPIVPSLAPCLSPSPRCALLSVPAPLSPGMLYDVALPKGSSFHRESGPTAKQLSIVVSGLVPFVLPFVEDQRPRYRRFRLWLRHGLQPGTDVAQLASKLQLTTSKAAVPFKLTLSEAAVLVLEAPFAPATAYTLSVSASDTLRDGFGLPLRSASTHFTTVPLQDMYLLPGGTTWGDLQPARFPAGLLEPPASWPYVYRGCGTSSGDAGSHMLCMGDDVPSSSIVRVTPADVPAVISSLHNDRTASFGKQLAGANLGPATIPDRSDRGALARADLGSALRAPGLLLQRTTRGRAVHTALLSAGELTATAVAAPDGSYLVWITNTSINAPVAGASLQLFCRDATFPASVSSVKLCHTGTTDGASELLVRSPRRARGCLKALGSRRPSERGVTQFPPPTPAPRRRCPRS